MPLNIDVSVNIAGVYTGSNDIAAPEQLLNVTAGLAFMTGTAAGQAQKVFSDTRTIAASSSESLDLAGTLTDAFGATITFASVKAIYVFAHADNTNQVVVGDAASDAFIGPWGATGTQAINPGGVAFCADPIGFAVTATTADLLKVANSSSGSSVTYDVVIIGS